ncbi:MAG: hypothetical protein K0U20_09040 [Proteobacteria bacterium]|nr:hypothetical protein [Pseudomonadota bacterium]
MGLREQIEADNRAILNDGAFGFGYSITLTDPTGNAQPLTGFSNDISQLIDPDTGQAVSGRVASAALNINDILTAGFTELPKSIADSASKPWLITFDDINGNTNTFKISQSNPDRTIGMIVCILEFYKVVLGNFVEWTAGDTLEWATGDSIEWTTV